MAMAASVRRDLQGQTALTISGSNSRLSFRTSHARRLAILCFGVGLASLAATPCVAAQTPTPERVLIRNVVLVDDDGEIEDVVVSILIKDGRLDTVTEEEIPIDQADLAVTAQGGVLMGTLDLGQPASFLILDGDPRENMEILLDTATYAHFAIIDGVIIKNTLPRAAPAFPDEEQRRSGWLAYTPPPVSLITSYQDSTKWNRWDTKYISGIFTAAVVLDRQRWVDQDEANEEQVGDLADFERGEIRGLRFGAVGTLNFARPWIYTVFAATHAFDQGFDTTKADDFTLIDYRVDIPLGNQGTLSIGKQKEPISMERIMGMVFLPMQERTSVSDALMPSRNVGIVYNNTLVNQRVSYAGGVFNDWFDAGEKLDESATQFVGRVTALPFLHESEGSLVHVGLGWRYTNAKQGVRLRTEPEFNSAPDFVDTGLGFADTGLFEAESAITWDFELSARRGPIWIASEFVKANASASAQGDPSFFGYHITGSWIVTGEMRGYNKRSGVFGRVPIAKALNQDGWGAWELAVRWSSLDLTDGAIEGGKMQILSLGVNWWPVAAANVNVNFRSINLDRFGIIGNAKGINGRIVLVLE